MKFIELGGVSTYISLLEAKVLDKIQRDDRIKSTERDRHECV